MSTPAPYSERAMAVWQSISSSRFSQDAQTEMSDLKRESYEDYCAVLGLVFGIALYRNDALPEGARGEDGSAYCVTVPSAERDSFPGELPVSRDPIALCIKAAEMWSLDTRFTQSCQQAEFQHLLARTRAPAPPTQDELAALDRLIRIAQRDTGQSRRVASFLLAWWNSATCGGFDLTELWAVDEDIANDMQAVVGLIARVRRYPDKVDPALAVEFERIIERWRPELLEPDA